MNEPADDAERPAGNLDEYRVKLFVADRGGSEIGRLNGDRLPKMLQGAVLAAGWA
jgi:hypothetical protein